MLMDVALGAWLGFWTAAVILMGVAVFARMGYLIAKHEAVEEHHRTYRRSA